MGPRDRRTADGSELVDLSSWRRRLVDGGVGEREKDAILLSLRLGKCGVHAHRWFYYRLMLEICTRQRQGTGLGCSHWTVKD